MAAGQRRVGDAVGRSQDRQRFGLGLRVAGVGLQGSCGEVVLGAHPIAHPATVDFLQYGYEFPWPREGDGLGYSIELTSVEPFRDNDLGVYWRRSRELGGSPGKIEGISPDRPVFRRGDPNVDGAVNLTDAISILGHLFQGAGELPCMASADVDGNKELQLADPILLLRYLFQGADQAIPSPGPGECAPVSFDECKQSNCRT